MRYKEEDILLVSLSLNHAMAFSYQFLPALVLGLTQVVITEFHTETIVAVCQTDKITSISLLPTMAYQLANYVYNHQLSIPSLRSAFIAGDILPVAMRDQFNQAFKFYPIVGIGMTETYGYCFNFDTHANPLSSGRTIAGFKAHVTQEGELEIKGPCVFHEYYQQPELTQQSFNEGWFKTGDLAHIN